MQKLVSHKVIPNLVVLSTFNSTVAGQITRVSERKSLSAWLFDSFAGQKSEEQAIKASFTYLTGYADQITKGEIKLATELSYICKTIFQFNYN